jgi:hypothetical protein
MIHTFTFGSVAEGSTPNYKFKIKENYFRFNAYVRLTIRENKRWGDIIFEHTERIPTAWGSKYERYFEDANRKVREIANEKLNELERQKMAEQQEARNKDPFYRIFGRYQ